MKFFLMTILAAGFATAAQAGPDAQAFRAYVDGEYETAAADAAQLGGAENLALAARALNALAYLETDDSDARKIADRALEYAEAANEADPALVEAQLQAAIALAQRGARMAPWRAFFLDLAGRAREALDAALNMDPGNAWALSSSAAWHLEVSRRGGEGRFDSDPDAGYQQFLAAREAAPENLLIAYECALRLIAYDRSDWRSVALQSLDAALALSPENAFEAEVQDRARAFQQAIASGHEAERDFIEEQP